MNVNLIANVLGRIVGVCDDAPNLVNVKVRDAAAMAEVVNRRFSLILGYVEVVERELGIVPVRGQPDAAARAELRLAEARLCWCGRHELSGGNR